MGVELKGPVNEKTFVSPQMKKSIFLALYGHVLERYDVTLYGYVAIVLIPLFFPQDIIYLSYMSGMGAFAAGYIMRPFGGMIFGYLGDVYGRKKALTGSILLVSIPTLIIGCLPTYDQIGWISPLLLILCRLFQGICVGGEYAGAAVYFFESCKKDKHGFFGSFMSSTAFSGAILGSIIGTLSTLPLMPSWGWRIPFIFGAFLSLIGFALRRNMKETPTFNQFKTQADRPQTKNFIFELFKTNKVNLFSTFCIGAIGYIFLYTSTIYMSSYIHKLYNLENYQIMIINTFILFCWVIFIIITGYLSDIFGKKRMLRLSCFCALSLTLPIFHWISKDPSLALIISLQVLISSYGASFFGVAAGFLPSLFKTGERYSGVSLGLNLGQACFGGTTPLIATALVYLTDDDRAPGLMIMFAALIGLLALKLSKISRIKEYHSPEQGIYKHANDGLQDSPEMSLMIR